MEANEERIKNREIAYEYIRKAVGIKADASEYEVTKLVDVLGDEFSLKDDLKRLKEGISDPTETLIKSFKFTNFVWKLVPESEIDSYLVAPFKDLTHRTIALINTDL
jgi:hypothetical protein